MNKNRIYRVFAFLICFLLLSPHVIASQKPEDVVISMQIGNPLMAVNGENQEIDPGRGTEPIIKTGRTLVPVRAIIEAFGGKVDWKGKEKTAVLTLENDTIKLIIDSKKAYLNGALFTLDVAPSVYNDRTMLPIRFIAESFNLGVAWDEATEKVYIIRDLFQQGEYDYLLGELKEYSKSAYIKINNNKPFFKDYEIIPASFEYYSSLDGLGRCDVCVASVSLDTMPTEKRGNISSIKPTGWKNRQYDFISGKYLYNRCHLLGFQLTGENANPRNLITGTRYMNVEGMLPFENMVDSYIDKTGNHVMYRVTPVFQGDNLVASGVLMEAYSVEDKGKGLSFCVYCYNVQQGVFINYANGENKVA